MAKALKIDKDRDILVPGMMKVEEKLYAILSESNSKTCEICTDLIKSGGKRVRPLLVVTAAQCFSGLNHQAINAAVAFELVHMASLVHDDIIDNAQIRRNKPSVNNLVGNQSSVLIGDFLFAKAFEVLSKNRLVEIMQLMVEAIGEMCDGEITQASNKFNLNQSTEDYYRRIYKKTGVLISACCQGGAMAGGATGKEVEYLKSYGVNIGYAYQIIDDILDFTGNMRRMGKPTGNDLKDGNITLPIIKLIKQREYKDWFISITKNNTISPENYKEVLRVLRDSYAIEETYGEAEKCIKEAKKSIDMLQNSKFKAILISLADRLLVRLN